MKQGQLLPWLPDLGPRRRPQRRLLVTREFQRWAQKQASSAAPSRLVSAQVELDEIAAQFVAGEKIVSFIHRIDPPKGQGVLRLNTASFRLAGWCGAPQTLVLAVGARAADTHGGSRRLSDIGKDVVRVRERLGLSWEKGEFYVLFQA